MEKIIVQSIEKTNNPDKYALFIGRWQPFHDGHQWLIDQKLNEGKRVCIAIRDVPKDDKNWWSADEIQKMLEEKLKTLIDVGMIKVIQIPDIESINIGRGVGYDIIEHIPPQEIHDISATKIRNKLKNK
jgi:cytidyltransferase-like protein